MSLNYLDKEHPTVFFKHGYLNFQQISHKLSASSNNLKSSLSSILEDFNFFNFFELAYLNCYCNLLVILSFSWCDIDDKSLM